MKDRKIWKYKGLDIFPAGRNSSGIRWCCLSPSGILRADTKTSMRELITLAIPGGKSCKP